MPGGVSDGEYSRRQAASADDFKMTQQVAARGGWCGSMNQTREPRRYTMWRRADGGE